MARGPRDAKSLAKRADRVPNGGCWHAAAVALRLDAAEHSNDLRPVPDGVPEHPLGAWLQVSSHKSSSSHCFGLCNSNKNMNERNFEMLSSVSSKSILRTLEAQFPYCFAMRNDIIQNTDEGIFPVLKWLLLATGQFLEVPKLTFLPGSG